MSKNKIFEKHLRDKTVDNKLPILGEPYENTGIISPNKELGQGGGVTDGDKVGITVSQGGTVFTVNDDTITTAMIKQNGASINQVLKWDGTKWNPANDANTTYTAGQGLELVTNQFKLAQNNATVGQVLKWNGTGWIPANDEVSGNTVNYFAYRVGDAYIVATDPNVTFQKVNGFGTFGIPPNKYLISARIHGNASDLLNNTFTVIFNGNNVFNTTLDSFFPPTVMKYDRGLEMAPSETIPYVYDIDNTPQVQITGVNPMKIRVINLNGIANWGLKITL
jgi:hypothetical protein